MREDLRVFVSNHAGPGAATAENEGAPGVAAAAVPKRKRGGGGGDLAAGRQRVVELLREAAARAPAGRAPRRAGGAQA